MTELHTPKRIDVFDTTLRDGAQFEGISLTVEDKLRIAEQLDYLGVDYIEGGWPGANPKDEEFFRRAVSELTLDTSTLVAFGSTRRVKGKVDDDPTLRNLVEAGTSTVCIVGKAWDYHVTEALRTDLDEGVAMVADSIAFLKSNGLRVFFDAEHFFDGYRHNPEFSLRVLEAAAQAGADCVVLCDTNGGSLPFDVERIVANVVGYLSTPVGVHLHNDTDCGVANALAGVRAGAVHVQGTINGYGERTGNCNLTSVIPNVALKLKKNCVPPESLPKLKKLSQFVDEIANVRHNPRLPWVGSAAFSHKGGQHVNAVQKVARSYEHAEPSLVGNKRTVLISDLAGKSNIVLKAQELGFKITNDTPELKAILARIKELEHQGYEFEAAEGSLALLVRKILKHEEAPFTVAAYHVSMRRDGLESIVEATIKVRVGDQAFTTQAESKCSAFKK